MLVSLHLTGKDQQLSSHSLFIIGEISPFAPTFTPMDRIAEVVAIPRNKDKPSHLHSKKQR